jgi:hypothetical protein
VDVWGIVSGFGLKIKNIQLLIIDLQFFTEEALKYLMD